MPHGLPRKIRIAFILQAVLASLGILLGAWLVSLVIKHSLVGAALREEAAYYWTLHEASPVQPPPNTQNIRGYLLESGQSALSLPANLRNLEPGFHELPRMTSWYWSMCVRPTACTWCSCVRVRRCWRSGSASCRCC